MFDDYMINDIRTLWCLKYFVILDYTYAHRFVYLIPKIYFAYLKFACACIHLLFFAPIFLYIIVFFYTIKLEKKASLEAVKRRVHIYIQMKLLRTI